MVSGLVPDCAERSCPRTDRARNPCAGWPAARVDKPGCRRTNSPTRRRPGTEPVLAVSWPENGSAVRGCAPAADRRPRPPRDHWRKDIIHIMSPRGLDHISTVYAVRQPGPIHLRPSGGIPQPEFAGAEDKTLHRARRDELHELAVEVVVGTILGLERVAVQHDDRGIATVEARDVGFALMIDHRHPGIVTARPVAKIGDDLGGTPDAIDRALGEIDRLVGKPAAELRHGLRLALVEVEGSAIDVLRRLRIVQNGRRKAGVVMFGWSSFGATRRKPLPSSPRQRGRVSARPPPPPSHETQTRYVRESPRRA